MSSHEPPTDDDEKSYHSLGERLYDVHHFTLKIYLVHLEFYNNVFVDGKIVVVADKNIKIETTLKEYMKANHPTQTTYSVLLYYDMEMEDYLPLSVWIEISKKKRKTIASSDKKQRVSTISFQELITTPLPNIHLSDDVSIQQFIRTLMFYFKLDQCYLLMETSNKDICYFTTYKALYHLCVKIFNIRHCIPPLQIVMKPHVKPPSALKYAPFSYSIEEWPGRHQHIIHITGCMSFTAWKNDIMEVYYSFVPRISSKQTTPPSKKTKPLRIVKKDNSDPVLFASNYAKYDNNNLFGKK